MKKYLIIILLVEVNFKLLKKMIKQRVESIDIYKKNNRQDLLEVEQKEHDILSPNNFSSLLKYMSGVLSL